MRRQRGEDVNDVLGLIDICEKVGFLDSGQINMLGASRGGMMTYEILRLDDRIHRAAVTGGVADAFAVYEARDDMKKVFLELVGGTPETMPEEYERRSAVCWADEITTPLLIIHAREDAGGGTARRKSWRQNWKNITENTCFSAMMTTSIQGFTRKIWRR